MMEKVVHLIFDGDMVIGGFRVFLEIKEGDRTLIQIRGSLPPNPELAIAIHEHWRKYGELGLASRITPKSATHNINSSSTNQDTFSTRLQESRESGENLRNPINKWLKSEQFRKLDTKLREELSPTDRVRLLIRTEDNNLRKLPLELWDFMDSYPAANIAISSLEYKMPRLSPKRAAKSEVRILAILGCSTNLNLEKEKQLLESLPNAKVVFLPEPKHNEINDKLWEQPWDIIFFAGHSETDGDIGRIYINETDSLTIDEIWYGLRKSVANGLQLAIFNSCDGLGLVRRLDDLEIPQMIVMREMIPDFVAQQFLNNLLTKFANGDDLSLAFKEAREKLQGWETDFPCASWLPVICQNPSVEALTWNDLLGAVEGEDLPVLPPPIRPRARFNPSLKFKLAVSLLLTVGLVGWQFGAPKLGKVVNNFAFDRYLEGDLITARKGLRLAEILSPDNRVVPYTLGWLCQDVQDLKCARKYYRRSAELGFASAYSQLARLLIVQDKDYHGALNLLWQGLELAKDDATKYSLHKNIGWALLELGRYEEALKNQDAAIKLDNKRAPAHCLKAEVLDGMNDPKAAVQEWQACLILADQKNADENIWMGKARARLNLK